MFRKFQLIVTGIAHQLAGLPGGEWGALARHYPPPLLPPHAHFTPHVLPPAHAQHHTVLPPTHETGGFKSLLADIQKIIIIVHTMCV